MNADPGRGVVPPHEEPDTAPRRRSLVAVAWATAGQPIRSLIALLGGLAPAFGIARSRRSVLRNGWILGDKDR